MLEADDAEDQAAFFAWLPPVPELALEVRDDRGRQYRDWGGERSWGSDLELREEPRYGPALDPAARELWLTVAQVRWRTAAVWQGGAVIALDRGPWAFRVVL